MKDAAYSKMGYPVVSPTNPYLNITVRNVDLSRVTPVGAAGTYAKIYRVGRSELSISVLAVEVVGNTFKFIMPALFLANEHGRYTYELFYKGNFIGSSQLQYNKVAPNFEESLRV
jgi:hypothetical protein